jgi:hypothetical protein
LKSQKGKPHPHKDYIIITDFPGACHYHQFLQGIVSGQSNLPRSSLLGLLSSLGSLSYELNKLKKPNKPVNTHSPPGSVFYVFSLREILPFPR